MMSDSIFASVIAAAVIANCGASPPRSQSAPATTLFDVGTAPGSIEIADFNGDGRLDIVVANEQSNDVTILLGDGKGRLALAKGSPFRAGPNPNDIAIGDFNRDGRLDFAIANHEAKYLTVLLGEGNGRFIPAAASPFAIEVTPHTHGVATGDLNGDGNLDLVTDSWATDQVGILFGDGNGSFRSSGRFLAVGKMPYQRVRVGDVNGDGNADIVTTNLEGNSVTVLLGDGKGAFKQSVGSPVPCGDSPFNFAIGDVNKDGKADLAIVNSPSSANRSGRDGLTILLGDGMGGFETMAGSPFAAGQTLNRVAVGDLNGDGIADVAASNTNGNSIMLLLMGNKSSVASSVTIATGRHPKGVASGDLDGDGKAEIVVANNGDNSISVLLSRDISALLSRR